MKDQVATMRATLEPMKADLAKVKDRAVKQQSQFDLRSGKAWTSKGKAWSA